MSARASILQRIRSAVRAGSAADSCAALPRTYMQHAHLDRNARVALMAQRLREYDAIVAECAPDQLANAIAEQLALIGQKTVVAPPGLPPEWRCPGYHWRLDPGLTHEEIQQANAVVTAAFCGVAESGTIVLHHAPGEGRRVLTLLPDWHLCVLYASQIVEVLPEYFARCPEPPRLVTFIAGPSATADIEMTRIKGVHGPRFLHVILVRDAP